MVSSPQKVFAFALTLGRGLKTIPLLVKENRRRGYSTVEAANPADNKLWEIYISHRLMDKVARQGFIRAKELAYLVPQILRKPKGVFQGVREQDDGWLCYCGVPDRSFRGKEGEVVMEPWPEEVFLVFVNQDRVMYHFCWEKADEQDPSMPYNHESRFERRIL